MPAEAADAGEGGARGAGDASTGAGGRRRRGHVSLEYEDDGAAGGGGEAAALGSAGTAGAAGTAGPLPKLPPGSSREDDEAEEMPAHELLSLEWLRDAPDSVARDYLMNIDGGGGRGCGASVLTTVCTGMLAEA